ncbi:hypothetical protein J6590_060793 [Homalodisca vitripennis]|nr:hypothetical protein J6590_060793 [Homalodisca vitripennis]
MRRLPFLNIHRSFNVFCCVIGQTREKASLDSILTNPDIRNYDAEIRRHKIADVKHVIWFFGAMQTKLVRFTPALVQVNNDILVIHGLCKIRPELKPRLQFDAKRQ